MPSRRGFLRTVMSAITLPACARCGEAFTAPGIGDPRLSARPGTPTVAPVAGLTELGLGGSRDGYVWVPEGYTGETPVPLVVALHGAGQSADLWHPYRARADALGFVLLAPDSRAATWDVVGGTFGPDVAFLDAALAFTFERCWIDAARIALAGFSDGASYALSLGVSNGDVCTHLIAYSPGFIRAADPVVGRPSIFVSHGTGDPVLPYRNTRDDIVPRLRDEGYAVTFQTFDGGHSVPSLVSDAALDWLLR